MKKGLLVLIFSIFFVSGWFHAPMTGNVVLDYDNERNMHVMNFTLTNFEDKPCYCDVYFVAGRHIEKFSLGFLYPADVLDVEYPVYINGNGNVMVYPDCKYYNYETALRLEQNYFETY